MTSGILLPLLLLAPVLVCAALGDLRHMRIPNVLSLAGLALFALCLPLIGLAELPLRIAAAGAVFAAGFALFAVGLVGGGDVKLLSVLVLFVPPDVWALYANLLAASLLAGVAFVMAVQAIPNGAGSAWAVRRNRGSFPMGLSIALSGLTLPLAMALLAS